MITHFKKFFTKKNGTNHRKIPYQKARDQKVLLLSKMGGSLQKLKKFKKHVERWENKFGDTSSPYFQFLKKKNWQGGEGRLTVSFSVAKCCLRITEVQWIKFPLPIFFGGGILLIFRYLTRRYFLSSIIWTERS